MSYTNLWCIGAIFFLMWAQYRSLYLISNVFVDLYSRVEALEGEDDA